MQVSDNTWCNNRLKHFLQWYLFAWFLTLVIGGAIFGSRQIRFAQVVCTGWPSRDQCAKAGYPVDDEYGYACVAWTTEEEDSRIRTIGVAVMSDDSWAGNHLPDACWQNDGIVTFANPTKRLHLFFIILFSFLGLWSLLFGTYVHWLRRLEFRNNKLRMQLELQIPQCKTKIKTKQTVTNSNTIKHHPRPPSSSPLPTAAAVVVVFPPIIISTQ